MYTRTREESCFLRAHIPRSRVVVTHMYVCTYVLAHEDRSEGAPSPLRAAVRKNLSVEAGNAIEVITSLITTLHAIRDREFVFHERTASTMHPFPVFSSPTLALP